MTVDPGTAISVSDRFCRIFLHPIGTNWFASVWLNAFGRVINNHKYCELLVMRN